VPITQDRLITLINIAEKLITNIDKLNRLADSVNQNNEERYFLLNKAETPQAREEILWNFIDQFRDTIKRANLLTFEEHQAFANEKAHFEINYKHNKNRARNQHLKRLRDRGEAAEEIIITEKDQNDINLINQARKERFKEFDKFFPAEGGAEVAQERGEAAIELTEEQQLKNLTELQRNRIDEINQKTKISDFLPPSRPRRSRGIN
jgi:hypothetical protein